MWHITNKKGKCAHLCKERALDATQIINFLPNYHFIEPFKELCIQRFILSIENENDKL